MTKKQELTVIEPNILMSEFNKLTINELRSIFYCLSRIYIKDGIKDELYEFNIKEYSTVFGVSYNTAYVSVIDVFEKLGFRMLDMPESLFTPMADKNMRRKFYITDHCVYNPKTGELGIHFSRSMQYILNNLGEDFKYTKFFLESIVRLKTMGAIKLFRVLTRINNSKKKEYSLKEFKELLGFDDGEYKEFDDFNQKFIKPGMRELGKLEGWKGRIGWKREGRKVIGVEIWREV